MCKCTPNRRTPYCGKLGCEAPNQKPVNARAPATPAEAEELAKKAVGDYLTACRMDKPDPEAMGNYLMKLASVTGVMMANAEGSVVAWERLYGTAMFVAKTMPTKPATLRPVQ
jgi:hypothetical protein